MQETDSLAEAERLMTVCNACRYCEGLCAVFPAMELRRVFSAGDLNYLATLCHSCGACYDACQFAPPHEFAINVPAALARVRNDSYVANAWPKPAKITFWRNRIFASSITVAATVFFLVVFALRGRLGASPDDSSFYSVISHGALVAIFGGIALFTALSLGAGLRAFWRAARLDKNKPVSFREYLSYFASAAHDAARLKYLDGGGAGCATEEDRPDHRRFYHHLTSYGFLLCFAATSVATIYHYLFNREAPYPFWDLPVVLGTVGGLGLIAGSLGLLKIKFERPKNLTDRRAFGMEIAFLVLLLATSVSGLSLLVFRGTACMPALLAIHLGIVFALFATIPYGKFVHAFYRFVALAIFAEERHDNYS